MKIRIMPVVALIMLLSVTSVQAQASPAAEPPLFAAVKAQDAQKVAELLAAKPDLTARDREGVPVLTQAVLTGNLAIVAMLLDAGADPNLRGGGYGNTAVFMATEHGTLAMLKLLVAKGGRLDLKNDLGLTPFASAIVTYDFRTEKQTAAEADRVIAWLAEQMGPAAVGKVTMPGAAETFEPFTSLILAAAMNDSDKNIRLLLSKGAPLNDRVGRTAVFANDFLDADFYDGMTALMMAAAMNKSKPAAALLEAGADVTVRTRSYNMTAAMLAYGMGNAEVLETLGKKGVALTDEDKRQALLGMARLHRNVLESNLRISVEKWLDARVKDPGLKIATPDELRRTGVILHEDVTVRKVIAGADSFEVVMRHGKLTEVNSKIAAGLNPGEGKVVWKDGAAAVSLPEVAISP